MSEISNRSFPSIFHPTDFSLSSNIAFEHALKIALGNRSSLSILHVDAQKVENSPWGEFPQVRETLERWGQLPKGSPREAVADKLGIRVKKVERGSQKPLAAISSFLDHDPADLIVLATEGREGLPRWLNPSVSENLARRSMTATLFVPVGARTFISRDNGNVGLERVLIPVDQTPNPQVAVDAAGGLLRSIEAKGFEMETLFVGDADRMPDVMAPSRLECTFKRSARSGKPVDEIIGAAVEGKASLIVMATEGRNGFLDALRGSTTEQVLRRAPCPVLAIPAPVG